MSIVAFELPTSASLRMSDAESSGIVKWTVCSATTHQQMDNQGFYFFFTLRRTTDLIIDFNSLLY